MQDMDELFSGLIRVDEDIQPVKSLCTPQTGLASWSSYLLAASAAPGHQYCQPIAVAVGVM
jgi:hypothetical protein